MTEDTLEVGVCVTLDRPRKLQYHAFAFLKYQEVLGRELLDDLQGIYKRFQEARAKIQSTSKDGKVNATAATAVIGQVVIPFGEMTRVLWAGLLEDDETLTIEQVSKIFGMGDVNTLLPAISAAVNQTMRDASTARPTIEPVGKRGKSGRTSGSVSVRTSESMRASQR